MRRLLCLRAAVLPLVCVSMLAAQEPQRLKVLFLGDNGPHRPRERFTQIEPVLTKRGIDLAYTDNVGDLGSGRLQQFDALLLYANIDRIEPADEKGLLDYVADGRGFVPIHCASYCFRNSNDVVALVGAQFRRHGTGVFRPQIAEANHPIMQGFGGFESWDETYVHHLHNEANRTVLSYRVDAEGREPWTWVRTHGKGRVFYTAWGHDHRTWGNPGFQNLLERGIRWATCRDLSVVPNYLGGLPFPVPEMTDPRTDVKPFEYADVGAKIPNYTPSRVWGTQGDPFSLMQKPLPPEESIKHFVVPRGFRVELVASEPDLGGKPISMTWDERGRLWVAETYDYPNELQPPGNGRDRIRICEDTDGDWRADKFTVFADSLSIPTSIAFHRGGVIVQDATRTLYLKDTDGDDVADERRVLFSGWNQRDTHGGVSNFQYGLDNWMWAMQGYNPSRPAIDGVPQEQFSQGFFRFRADGSHIEFIRSTSNNTWGLGISEEGIIFGSTANRNPSVYMPIANRYYERVRGWTPSLVLEMIADTHLFKPITDKIRQVDHHGGYTAGAGHALYTARAYPQEYWNRVAFVNGPTGHLVGAFVLEREGSDFRSSNKFNLLASDDAWSAPIMAEVGPDGNVWVIDWYNYIVQHNPTPRGFKTGPGNAYETDLRDKKHGRIYRVVYESAPPARPRTLAGASADELVATLKSDNMFWRKHAQRLLVERGKTDVLTALFELVGDPQVDPIRLNTATIHALWTIYGLGALDGSHAQATAVAVASLGHPSAGVRRNAIQVLPPNVSAVEAILAAGMLGDSDAQVRLAALLALADLPATVDAGGAIAKFMSEPGTTGDRWLTDAVIAAAATNDASFLTAVAKLTTLSDRLDQVVPIVAEHYARGGPADTIGPLVVSLPDAHPQIAAAIVNGLASGWPSDRGPKLNEELESSLERLVGRLEVGAAGQLIKLAANWGSLRLAKHAQEVVSAIQMQLGDTSRSDRDRLASAEQLIEFQPASAAEVAELLGHVTPQTSPELASGFVDLLRRSQSPQLGKIIIERVGMLSPTSRATAIAVLLSRTEATRSLLDAIDEGHVQLAELSLDQRQSLASHPDRALRSRARRLLERGGALVNADRQKVLDDLLPITETTGDAANGKVVFKKVCAKCHKHRDEGENIGPDLTGMAVHPKEELLAHIIDPNRSVEGNFRLYNVVTTDGRVFSGMLASESRTAVELFDAEGKRNSVLRADIDELIASGKSLMPEGVEKEISREELTDLLEFLAERGRFVPVDLSKAATIASDRGMFNDTRDSVERLVPRDWTAKTVKGVPFYLIDPQGGKVANVILLYGPQGAVSARMPRSVSVPINGVARCVHLLSGVSGWGYPYSPSKSVSMIVRIHYADGQTEDHELQNGVHFADYIRRVDVPQSEFALELGSQQIRYLAVTPGRGEPIERIEFAKGDDRTAPVVMAVTIETSG